MQCAHTCTHNLHQAVTPDGKGLLLTVPNTSLPANATQGSYNAWPVVSVYSSAGLPALPWAPTPIAGTCPGQGVWA